MRHETLHSTWSLVHAQHMIVPVVVVVTKEMLRDAYQPPLCPVSHPLGLTLDSSCICDFTHFVLSFVLQVYSTYHSFSALALSSVLSGPAWNAHLQPRSWRRGPSLPGHLSQWKMLRSSLHLSPELTLTVAPWHRCYFSLICSL